MGALILKQHDTAQGIEERLEIAGQPVTLTSATVVFVVKSIGTGAVRRLPATIADAAHGVVRWYPVDGDLDEAGDYQFEWEVTQTLVRENNTVRPTVQTFPSDGYRSLRVMPDLG